MRVSEYYNLGIPTGSLDFLDVEVESDTPLFIDPTRLGASNDHWDQECIATIQSFFSTVIDATRQGNDPLAKSLIANLGEVNETRLGYSSSNSGSGLGTKLAEDFHAQLTRSKAVHTGLLNDLEEMALLVPGVAHDRISDLCANVLRGPLCTYTEAVCEYYGIPTIPGFLVQEWSIPTKTWVARQANLPMPNSRPLILVPRSVVGHRIQYEDSVFLRHFVLPYYQDVELSNPKSPLVKVLRDKRGREIGRKVTKKSIHEKLAARVGGDRFVTKRINQAAAEENPGLLEDFANFAGGNAKSAPTREELDSFLQPGVAHSDNAIDAHKLLDEIAALKAGRADADAYERAAEALLGLLLYPALVHPRRQQPIHSGRKRIDIDFTNAGSDEFFGWIAHHFPASRIAVECKNYTEDPANPELDQLAGRFSPSRGQIGILLCRHVADRDAMTQRCRDTASDRRGYIIVLDDSDLAVLTKEFEQSGSATGHDGLLRERFDAITS